MQTVDRTATKVGLRRAAAANELRRAAANGAVQNGGGRIDYSIKWTGGAIVHTCGIDCGVSYVEKNGVAHRH